MRFKRAVLALLALSLGSAAAVEGAICAESIQYLFGVPFTPAQSYSAPPAVYLPPDPWAQRRPAPPRRTVAHRPAPKPFFQVGDAPPHGSALADELAAMQKKNPGALAIFMRDTTLRKQDAIMTDRGIRIFKGSEGDDHAARDFVPLTAAKGLPHRTELAAIQKAFVRHFEVMQLAKLTTASAAPMQGFNEAQASPKSFETIEIKAVRRIGGVAEAYSPSR